MSRYAWPHASAFAGSRFACTSSARAAWSSGEGSATATRASAPTTRQPMTIRIPASWHGGRAGAAGVILAAGIALAEPPGMRIIPFTSLLIVSAACGNDVEPPGSDAPPTAQTTWYQDVAPIVATHCMGCHQD